ncbi:Site-specific recombinase [Alloactinosynnema sp. L-07]|uniref:recombinase family protein n=1 Tax=Alloactinosynnema sp. L-07 TaxID=1653480 RepID=UPI00065EFEBD|nr:recombinase family protein [Alloactinosynnema sp. L-07]CRK59350.1 Site-specific recombinase [Alloactinosynnema sp. L-07]
MSAPDELTGNLPAPALTRRAGVPVSGPSGLSDYAVSPLGMPVALLRDEVRVAFLGRTSTEDQQDPRQSAVRQLGNCKTAIPASWVIVAHFYDVESGRMELEARGQGTDYERFDIPIARDGGITDLLAEAAHPGRRFDVVICESISRVARRAYEGLSIERELERAEVPLFAANEPITVSGSRAQRILQRRINQSVAEYEVLNTLEQSWGGLCTHVREGWNIGKPCYGYKAKTIRHPNPTKAAKGQTKTRLEPDGVRAETVTQIALWRYHEGIGYDTIADRLNADPTRYPPPEPPGKTRARGAWGKTSVYEILRNPKYTGYQVFNRRASRSRNGKVNDPIKWVWSTEPAHEPLIPKWMYDEFNARRAAKRGSRDGNGFNTHPETRRTYLLRSMLFCACGRRMFGNHRHERAYYMCWPRNNNRGRPDTYAGHPKAVYLREDAILDAVTRFFADRVFGPQRHAILAADIAGIDDRATHERHTERERLQRALADLTRRQNSIMRQAQDGDPDDPFTKALRGTYNDLEAERTGTLAAITQLDAADDAEPSRPGAADIALLDALPHLALTLAEAPEPLLRRLFEITQLSVRLRDDGDHVDIAIRLPADRLPDIAETAERINENMIKTQEAPAQTADAACVDAVRAPGRIRTCAPASGGRP